MTDEQAPPGRRDLRIGVRMSLAGDPGEMLADARAFESAEVHSLWADASDGDPYVTLAALAAVTWRVALVASGAPAASAGRATCERMARGRLVLAEELAQKGEHWVRADHLPLGRGPWREARAAATAQGATGIVVPNDPRLLDLLRNPDVADDRSDLDMAVG